jgi:hypothetical protein
MTQGIIHVITRWDAIAMGSQVNSAALGQLNGGG